MITKLAPVEYEPDASCPRWLAFLDEIMKGNTDLISYLQRLIGYAMTGDVREQILPVLYGPGANGKTSMINTMFAAMGDYARQAPPDLLMAKRADSHPTGLADLEGCRLLASTEVEEGRRLAEVLVKQITGGDELKARKMRQDYFQFKPTAKVFLITNHRPRVRGMDAAIWRRIKLIPFTVTIPEERQDKTLTEKMKAELPGILNWMLEGCLAWQRDGLGEPPEVREATKEYREEMDSIGRFLDERCVLSPTAQVTVGDLFATYQVWCRENNEWSRGKIDFGRRLREREFDSYGGKGNVQTWVGIGLTGLP